ncbi:MAG: hypothetical protein J6B67_00665 [Oscillospiraceae bacterium]|nr:hypothetical protein [Oscillospiraceae bacterium]
MNEKVAKALSYVEESYVSKAAKRKKKPVFIAAVAAVLAAVLLFNLPSIPLAISAKAVSTASGSRQMQRPDIDDYEDRNAWRAEIDKWQAEQKRLSDTTGETVTELAPFFTAGSARFLSAQSGENLLWSPVNAYIGLSMVTELTAGQSRQQILDLFGAGDTDALRRQVSAIWESAYSDNGHEISTLANSLWLEEGLSYQQQTMDDLAYHYYASVYQGDLGSQKINNAIGAWLNNNTGGFLKNATKNINLSPETVLALYSTIYFQAKWRDEFYQKNNTQDVFHTPNGDKTVTFMNKKLSQMDYYWGEKFSAVALGLKNGSRMWFILPDEGYTTADVLADGQYMQMVLQQDWENEKWMKVNLSVPKFDVSGTVDLKAGLQEMGVTDVFSEGAADFSRITADVPVFLTAANQSVRVQIDEEGVKAAAYIEFPGATSPEPPKEIIDFILDRPFVFAITTDSIPMFMGVVNEP